MATTGELAYTPPSNPVSVPRPATTTPESRPRYHYRWEPSASRAGQRPGQSSTSQHLTCLPQCSTGRVHFVCSRYHMSWQEFRQRCMFKQLGLREPWFVITHTIWTTQEDTVFISDRTGTVVNVQWESRRFEGLPHRQWKPERMTFFLTFTDILSGFHWRWGSPSKRLLSHWTLTTVPVLSLIKLCPLVSFKWCVLSQIRVLVILIVWTF